MIEGVRTFVDAMSEQTATAKAKEKIVFDEAFTLHHRTVFRTARAVLNGDGALAEDVTQEVFLRLYNNLDAINDAEMLRAWLIRVALNVARNTVRGNSRANTREENYVKETIDATSFTAEKDYEQRERIKEVQRALQKIKEPLRSCLVLKQQGLSYREIAESLSLNEASVGTFVARARREFVRFYGKIGSDKNEKVF